MKHSAEEVAAKWAAAGKPARSRAMAVLGLQGVDWLKLEEVELTARAFYAIGIRSMEDRTLMQRLSDALKPTPAELGMARADIDFAKRMGVDPVAFADAKRRTPRLPA